MTEQSPGRTSFKLAADYNSITVLLVDSDISSRTISRKILEGLGFQKIQLADSAVNAMQVLENENVDLVVSEWLIRGGKGLSLLKRLRGDRNTCQIPFVVLSTDRDKENLITALRFRANDYLIKPASEELISTSLERILSHRETENNEDGSKLQVINEKETTETASSLLYSATSVDKSQHRQLDDVTVLLLDEDEKSRRANNCMLKRMGFSQVIESGIAASAEKKLKEGLVDLVFSEWKIAEDNALDILHTAQGVSSEKKTPIAILSAFNDRETVLAALRAGASDYLVKPCRLKDLAQSVARLLPMTGKLINLQHS